jgi:integrase
MPSKRNQPRPTARPKVPLAYRVHMAYNPSSPPETVLKSLPMGTHDFLRVLGALLALNNHQHSTKNKSVSIKTMQDRSRFYFGFFRELRHKTRYSNLDPRQLANRHIQAMVDRWLERGLSTATIHNYLSFLRTFAEWIGKPGMVQAPIHYVGAESTHAHRKQVATHDHSWTAYGVDVEALIAEVALVDEWCALQLELCYRFAMRPKEARHLRPHMAILPREAANPRDAAAFPECETFLRISFGTKGGRPRDVPIVDDAQRELLDRVMAAVAPGAFVGRPGFTADQNRTRFYYVMRCCGIAKSMRGIVPHGLRHQRANDVYEAESGVPSPVRGGHADPDADESARHRVSHMLGHSRSKPASSYIGPKPRRRGKGGGAGPEDPPSPEGCPA